MVVTEQIVNSTVSNNAEMQDLSQSKWQFRSGKRPSQRYVSVSSSDEDEFGNDLLNSDNEMQLVSDPYPQLLKANHIL